jgi:hypothetical protein
MLQHWNHHLFIRYPATLAYCFESSIGGRKNFSEIVGFELAL